MLEKNLYLILVAYQAEDSLSHKMKINEALKIPSTPLIRYWYIP